MTEERGFGIMRQTSSGGACGRLRFKLEKRSAALIRVAVGWESGVAGGCLVEGGMGGFVPGLNGDLA
jgi:hypothetical protein